MSGVQHIDTPAVSMFVKGNAVITTRKESFQGPTPVLDAARQPGKVAYWGPGNDLPQRVIDDKRSTSLVAAVIERKVNMLISGGLRYGHVRYDDKTGQDILVPKRDPVVEQFFKDSNIKLYLREAANDWYTFYNIFTEFRMGRGFDRVVGIGTQDASHVRLGIMDDQAEINKAWINDWRNAGEGAAYPLPALDFYTNIPEQLLREKHARSILPQRFLIDGQFYYGAAPWHGLQANGWLDVAKRVPELKMLLLNGLMNIRYHIEIDDRYWIHKFKDWNTKIESDQLALMKKEADSIQDWLTKQTHSGAFISTMKGMPSGGDQLSLVKIHEMKLSIPEGAYIEDSQEADYIICRDMGLKPSLIGISPSKSGSSPGSGSEDRVSRTNHILDARADMDMVLSALPAVRDVNGWDPEYEFWFSNYHAATLDRTNQVDAKPHAGPER